MIRRPPRSTQSRSSAASDVYKRQVLELEGDAGLEDGHGHQGLPSLELLVVEHLALNLVVDRDHERGSYLGREERGALQVHPVLPDQWVRRAGNLQQRDIQLEPLQGLHQPRLTARVPREVEVLFALDDAVSY